jgi:hypothetical protein
VDHPFNGELLFFIYIMYVYCAKCYMYSHLQYTRVKVIVANFILIGFKTLVSVGGCGWRIFHLLLFISQSWVLSLVIHALSYGFNS